TWRNRPVGETRMWMRSPVPFGCEESCSSPGTMENWSARGEVKKTWRGAPRQYNPPILIAKSRAQRNGPQGQSLRGNDSFQTAPKPMQAGCRGFALPPVLPCASPPSDGIRRLASRHRLGVEHLEERGAHKAVVRLLPDGVQVLDA